MAAGSFTGAVRRFAGVGPNSSSHLEKWISGIGGLVSISAVILVCQAYLGFNEGAGLIASMGASAVLLFAVPHGPLSQPWAVLGGHTISAVIGVSCTRLGLDPVMSAALAVALAISAMYYLRCIHPPGGATALTAVAGGEAVHAMGFNFVLTPVLLNALVILLIAIVFNLAFPWRRYPAAWARKLAKAPQPETNKTAEAFTSEAFTTAASAINPAMGISEDNLATIFSLAQCNKNESAGMHPSDIHVDRYYCNGKFGPQWQIRRVVMSEPADRAGSDAESMLDYRVVAGFQRRHSASISRKAFAAWACYEVCLNESSWQRVEEPDRQVVTENAA